MIYFASDFHLGIDLELSSKEREQMLCRWLDDIKSDATQIFLVGDIFDFWFEYGSVVPKGFVRLLGKLAELTDQGIKIEAFTGNHDMWMRDYFETELGIPVHRAPIFRQIGNHEFMIGHGDGLGPGDTGYKLLKKVFSNPFCKWLFARLHPNFGIWMANYWSGRSRATHGLEEFQGIDKEWLIQYCERKLTQRNIDYFIFGHRHLPIDCTLSNGRSKYINLGDWMHHMSYAVYNGQEVQVKFYSEKYADRLIEISVP